MNAATYAPTWPLQGGAGRQEESAPPSVLLEEGMRWRRKAAGHNCHWLLLCN